MRKLDTRSRSKRSSQGTFTVQLQAFIKVHTLDLLREPRSTIALLISFLGLIGLLWGVDLLVVAASGTHAGILLGSIPLVAMTGLMTISFMLTTVPLVRHRSAGILRALGTTPAERGAYILGHVPVRAGAILLVSMVLLGIACASSPEFVLRDAANTFITLLLGGAMLLSFGFLFAARLTNLDVAMQLAYLISVAALATSGVFFPLSALPGWVSSIFRLLPTTWLAETLTAALTHSAAPQPFILTWGLMGATTLAASIAAVRLQRWQGE